MARERWLHGATARLLLTMLLLVTSACATTVIPRWDPNGFRELDTLQFLTVGPTEGQHWSTVWLVVLDDAVYIRLGSRAAGRMHENTTTPYVSVRIGGREYAHVRADDVPDMAGRVAAAMAAKYTTDILVRYATHPLTMRLVPDASAGEH